MQLITWELCIQKELPGVQSRYSLEAIQHYFAVYFTYVWLLIFKCIMRKWISSELQQREL